MNARWAVCLSCASLLFAPLLTGQTPVKSDSVFGYKRTANGASVRTQHGLLELALCGDSVVHITYTPSEPSPMFFHPKPWIAKTTWPAVPFTLTEDPNHLVILSTDQLRVTVERNSSAVVFEDAQGRVLVRESRRRRRARCVQSRSTMDMRSESARISISRRTKRFTAWVSTRPAC